MPLWTVSIILFGTCDIAALYFLIIPVPLHFKDVYDQLGSELPVYTAMFVNIGIWFSAHTVIISLIIIYISILLYTITLTDFGGVIKDRILFLLTFVLFWFLLLGGIRVVYLPIFDFGKALG